MLPFQIITLMKTLNAKLIKFPEHHKTYALSILGNFIDYNEKKYINDRLECLMSDIDLHGMTHPIIVSWSGYNVSVGHQRVWYALQRGYTHIDCYHVENQAQWEKVYHFTQSEDYWQKRYNSRYANL